MRKVVVFENLTLDGVMQSPGLPDEDTRGGFPFGGWAAPYNAMQYAGGEGLANTGPLLMGRRTYEHFYEYWPKQTDNPISTMLNNLEKYVASTTLQEPLPWQNSILLQGDAAQAVAALKQQPGKDFLVMGSGVLVESLMQHNLVDTYVLLYHPLIFGTGRRLFPDGCSATLELVETQNTPNGVIIATYRPA